MVDTLKNIQLCLEVCQEFHALGVNQDIDPRTLKESYNVIKQPSGLWFKSTKTSLHNDPIYDLIDFALMPKLKKLTELIDELDSEIKKFGGRVFITEQLVYKIIKGTPFPIIFIKEQQSKGRFQKVCDELAAHGYERDRFRLEETYNLSKNSGTEWSLSTSHENHSGVKKILNLNDLPEMKNLAAKIIKMDMQFKTNGGRIFISPKRVYRIKNKIELDCKL